MAGRIRQVTIREEPLQRLASLVTAARLATIVNGRPLSKPKATLAIGFGSRDTLNRIENGLRVLPGSYAMVERFFEWVPGSIINYLDHNGPEPHKPEAEGAPGSAQVIVPGYADLTGLTEDQQQAVKAVIQTMKDSRNNGS